MFKFININKVIKILILSDLALITGGGFVAPIFAIFLTENIKGGNVKVAGFAAAIYVLVEALVMVPSGKYLDRTTGEKDDVLFIVTGNILAALAVLGYIFSRLPWHIYFLEAIYGLGMGMNVPAYTAMFTKHIDKGREAFSWATRGALVGVSSALAEAVGGMIAYNFGFNALFTGVIIFIVLSAGLPFLILKEIRPKDGVMPKIPETKTIQSPLLK